MRRRLQCRIFPILSVLNTVIGIVCCQNSFQEKCTTSPRFVSVEPQADITVGAILPIHHPGEGVYGCAHPSQEGVQVYEAMRWAIGVLNKDSGLLDEPQEESSSFIPGVTLGLKVYDSCGHDASAVEHLTSLFPVLRSGPLSCGSSDQNSSLTIGVVDMSGISATPEISEVMRDYFIPSITLSTSTVISAEQIGQVLVYTLQDMRWESVVVIHFDDEYSIKVTKILTQTASYAHVCISSLHSIPEVHASSNHEELPHVRRVLNSVTSRLSNGSGILVVGRNKESLKLVFQVMAEMPATVSRLQWLFSWIPPPSSLFHLGDLLSRSRIFSITPYPDKLSPLESYWTALPQKSNIMSLEDRWFLEHLMSVSGCRISGFSDPSYHALPLCSQLNLNESPLDAVIRTSHAIPALTAVFTLGHAYRRAWEVKCQGSAGVCPELRAMSRREFVGQFLEPVEFLPREDMDDNFGRKRDPRSVPELQNGGSRLALAKYTFNPQTGINFTQVRVYDSHGSEVLESFEPVPSDCPPTGCRSCVRPRQSRLDDAQPFDSHNDAAIVPIQEGDLIIPLLLPIHQAGNSPFECGSAINAAAVQDLEAALWIIDKLNGDRTFLSGIKLGVSVVDTCSSPLLATQKLATQVMKANTDVSSALTFIASDAPEISLSAASVLSPLNISLISTYDVTLHSSSYPKSLGPDNYLFQIASPAEVVMQAAADVLGYIGWRFVSVVYDSNLSGRKAYDVFSNISKRKGICIGLEFEVTLSSDAEIDRLMEKLTTAKSQGSSVVILWTSETTTKRILNGYGKFLEVGSFHPGDLVFLSLGEWGEKPHLVQGIEKEALGSVIFQPQRGEIPDFMTYFRRLLPENNIRNPWFRELVDQELHHRRITTSARCSSGSSNCKESEAEETTSNPVDYEPSLSTVNTIQAVISIAAGLARLRNEVCQIELGLCASLLHQSQLRSLISQYTFFTVSPRQDQLGHVFRFNYRGFGESPVDIYNFRRGSGKTFKYIKVGSYQNRLSNLGNMVTYTSNGEVSLDSIPSECVQDCVKCQHTSVDHIVVPSSSNLYLAATVDVHDFTSNPLECGQLKPTRGFQNLEALLWALDKINSDPKILPGINLGLVIFDTCSSREKTSMDVSNFITGVQKGSDMPEPKQIIGFVADQSQTNVVKPIVDLTMPLKMTTISSSATSSEFSDAKKYSYLLRMKMPTDLIVSSFINILKYFRWTYVSVVYFAEHVDENWTEVFTGLEDQVKQHGIRIALVEKVQAKEQNVTAAMDIIAHRLKIKQTDGSRVVILLLPPYMVENLLSSVKTLQRTGKSKVGDFVWLSFDSLESFQMYPDQSLGALSIQPSTRKISEFRDYFTNLSIHNNTRNPWLREYWEQVFNCRGSSCYTRVHGDLHQVGFVQDKTVPGTANALYALAWGLDALRKSFCPEEETRSENACHAMKDYSLVREKLFEFTKKVNFIGNDGRLVMFGDKNYALGNFYIYNFQNVAEGVPAFMSIGQYNEATGLSINTSKAKGYNGREEVSLVNVMSRCNNSENCRPSEIGYGSATVMKVPANQEFILGVLLPVHQPGGNVFMCSQAVDSNSFQNLLALSYALELVNTNTSVLPQISLGTLAFDHCGRRQKAEEQIFKFIARDGITVSGNQDFKPRAVIAALTYGPDIADDLSPLFESIGVPQIASPTVLSSNSLAESQLVQQQPSEASSPGSKAKVVASLLERFNWKYVNIIHDGSERGQNTVWNFVEGAKSHKICIADSIQIPKTMSLPDMTDHLFDRLHPGDSRVVILMLEDLFQIRAVLEAAKKAGVLESYVWILMEEQHNTRVIDKVMQDNDVDIFAVRTETYEVPGFKDYYSSFTLGNHEPIPDTWFEEFWQHHFRCQLPDSRVVQREYPDACSGQERLESGESLEQNPFVYHTVNTVKTVAYTLHEYLRRYCIHGDAATNLDDCGTDARDIFSREFRKAMDVEGCEDEECGPIRISVGFQVFQVKKEQGQILYQQVGLWKEGHLTLHMDSVEFSSGLKPESVCHSQCGRCRDQLTLDPEALTVPRPPLNTNFRTLWGIIVSSLSVLGVLLVLICAAYFLISFQVTIGTTVLGYKILFGLFLLYAINFAFILTPTEGTCGVRRFALGLAYAIIFSGMLVKVMNIWRMMGYHGNRLLSDSYYLTSPATLLVISVGLVIIQIVLSSAWLILIPPKTGILDREWRCHPATTFEDELVISLVYVMLILAITILFSILTWRCTDNNHESRWIFTCCFLVALVWLTWTVLSTQIKHQFRDLTIIVANLLCATVVMSCMYLRKVYIFKKLTKDQESKIKTQGSFTVPNMYGTLPRHVPNLAQITIPHVANSGVNVKLYGSDNSAPSHMALIGNTSDDATSDSSSSVQVQATDLYPLEMYDGGSQFQPASLQLGGSSLVLDDSLTYNR